MFHILTWVVVTCENIYIYIYIHGPQDPWQVSGPTVGAAQTLTLSNSCMSTKSIDAKARLISVVEAFIVCSDVLQVLGLLGDCEV